MFSDTINTGIFVLEPEIFDYIEADRPVDFSSEVFPKLLAGDLPLYGAIADGYWEDVGTLDSYVRAHKDILDGEVQVNIPGFELSDGVWLGEGAEIHPEARINGPAVIGDNCRIEARSSIGQYTVLGANVRVRSEAQLERTVVNDNAYLGEAVRLRGTVVGRACDLRKGVRSEEGVVIGDECFIGEDALLVGRDQDLPVQDGRGRRHRQHLDRVGVAGRPGLFGRDGIVGLANVDITPEFATKVAMAYGSMLKKGSRVITSRDSSRSARMLKRAMMAGLNAAGINVEDLEVASVPVTRFIVRRPSNGGGITIRLVHDDPQSVIIRFFDERGLDITEDTQRKIERLFNREDFRRVFPGEIGDIGFAPRALEHYATALDATVDIEQIRVGRVQDRHRLRLRLHLVRHAQRAGQAGPRGAGRQPVRVDRRGDARRPRRPRRQRGRPGAGVGIAPRRGARPRRRAADPHRRRGPHPLGLRGAAGPAHPPARARSPATAWPCRCRCPRSPPTWCTPTAPRSW